MRLQRTRRMSLPSLTIFTVQLDVMLHAGVGLPNALEALMRAEDERSSQVAMALLQKIESGMTLSKAMSLLPDFDRVYVNLIRVGETSGQMHRVMTRLSERLRAETERQARIKGALTYPACMVGASIAMVLFLLYYMLPRFLSMFQDQKMALPALTRFLLGIGQNPWIIGVTAAFLLLLAGAAVWMVRHPIGQRVYQHFLFETPILKSIFYDALLATTFRSLALMHGSGIAILAAFRAVVADSTGYYRLDDALKLIEARVAESGNLHEAMAQDRAFPPLLVHLVGAGEAIGRVERFMERFSDMTDERVNLSISSFLQILEPVVMGVMGVVVATICLAAFLPIYQLLMVL